jgi:hypothetical protein
LLFVSDFFGVGGNFFVGDVDSRPELWFIDCRSIEIETHWELFWDDTEKVGEKLPQQSELHGWLKRTWSSNISLTSFRSTFRLPKLLRFSSTSACNSPVTSRFESTSWLIHADSGEPTRRQIINFLSISVVEVTSSWWLSSIHHQATCDYVDDETGKWMQLTHV